MIRRVNALVTILGLLGLAMAIRSPAASACSCVRPDPGTPHPAVVVDGTAGDRTAGNTPYVSDPYAPRPSAWSLEWSFVVESVARGPVASGSEISVHLNQGDGGSCGIDAPTLEPGRRYRVGGSYDDVTGTLHLNSCSGGFVEELAGAPGPPPSVVTTIPAGPPPTTAVAVTTTSPTEETLVAIVDDDTSGGRLDARLLAAGATAVAGAGIGLAAVRRFRKPILALAGIGDGPGGSVADVSDEELLEGFGS